MKPNKKVLLIGGTSGIGKALLERMLEDNKVEQIFATYHRRRPIVNHPNNEDPDVKEPGTKATATKNTDTKTKVVWLAMDVTSEPSIKQTIEQISEHVDHIDWVINAVGLLHNGSHQPEKAVRQLDPDFFIDNMKVNALPSLLIAKYIKPLLQARLKAGKPNEIEPAIYATISARVGSISDNKLGGWYSYRMSKAALNMGMKTLAIEWQRSLKNVCVAVMQPGTVDTPLSKPFQANVAKDKLFKPEQCADNLLIVLSQLTAEDTGCFVDWAGKPIEW
ncbi:SDR family NAD(P)-dependent oxidoreductase [Psychrobacter sanguinis]|uniref:SDR family NAD(P)-dependent oxidoreductase n=1 Tax=Psychrobacter sanguinis TaxID=861445 RepID=UPI00020C9448|nr:SDR family NAD(P)-dependent oxidoreductase [Psychrobacter sanguinis]EGK13257.1 short-chain dehydrogenase/reductase SDR [Psychrobacter sp. 1501(2011)]MCC3308969.1 SDR family NAD(P)-dependent oxidoreductase [Psychrobacter sanguinis]MCD9150322.1 SDR family NAD(P)-dependent oxidoreductase [Psychrobacter sanguinis]UEC26259.1 SDR family NAD(P)-dependent oxidoreductase [Psychrobacter sanguinis]